MLCHILCSLMGLSWWINTTITSAVLFGEYPYPSEEES